LYQHVFLMCPPELI